VKDDEKRIIQEGPLEEVNQWLTRTGWESYLKDTDRQHVIQCVSTPNAEKEPINAAIWEIIDGLIRR
jgi:hypothetical protein